MHVHQGKRVLFETIKMADFELAQWALPIEIKSILVGHSVFH